ncbi:hypothetical protein E2C01_074091 [Portunus trituberculatus]|uniref:Uncharacterized protein n=1 Tax=Portunus trituberculatus TaxID=210409 RepID=A0A5B7I4P5_PORTR|nr:hypothetical protein [Portunus trituberculatus]
MLHALTHSDEFSLDTTLRHYLIPSTFTPSLDTPRRREGPLLLLEEKW